MKKRKVVLKFGGTSVGNAKAIRRVNDIISAKLNECIIDFIVVSAVAGVTNKLVEFCISDIEKRKKIVSHILEIHLALATDLGLSLCNSIESLIKAPLLKNEIFYKQDLSEKDRDYVISLGEKISALIVHSYLRKSGKYELYHISATKLIITDDSYGKAVPNTSLIKSAVHSNLENFVSDNDEHYLFLRENGEESSFFRNEYDNDIEVTKNIKRFFITNGFISSTSSGLTTTLGRGGSDYSAALLAEAINSDEVLIYTDVSGVYTMDPNVVPTARLIKELYFHEMAEMANFGAKVLHPATLAPCMRAKIPVKILSTFDSHKCEGTLIIPNDQNQYENGLTESNTESDNNDDDASITALSMRRKQILVVIKSLKMLNAYGFLANIFNVLSKYKISVDLITTSEVSVALTIDMTSIGSHGVNPFLHNSALMLELSNFAEISVETNLTLIAVVGKHLLSSKIVQDVISLLGNHKIRLICYGASDYSIGFLVNSENDNEIVSIMHDRLIDK